MNKVLARGGNYKIIFFNFGVSIETKLYVPEFKFLSIIRQRLRTTEMWDFKKDVIKANGCLQLDLSLRIQDFCSHKNNKKGYGKIIMF